METRLRIVSFLFLAAAACATQPVTNQAAKMAPSNQILDPSLLTARPDTVEVTVKRDSGSAGWACSSKIFVDGQPVADLNPSEKAVLHLTKAEHILSATPNGYCGGGLSEVRADLRAGDAASFRVGYGSNGDFFINQTAF